MTSSTAHTTFRQTTSAGRRVEQARYRIPDGTRALVAQRINGRVALIDVPLEQAREEHRNGIRR